MTMRVQSGFMAGIWTDDDGETLVALRVTDDDGWLVALQVTDVDGCSEVQLFAREARVLAAQLIAIANEADKQNGTTED